jgi:hypothetical protein
MSEPELPPWKDGDEAIVAEHHPDERVRGRRVVLRFHYETPGGRFWIGFPGDGSGYALPESAIVRPSSLTARPEPATDRATSDLMLRLDAYMEQPR